VDPEELFRTIFGQAGFKLGGQGGFQDFNDFAESKYGFAPATEVYKNINILFQERFTRLFCAVF
jgi:DnaJ family protein A protein 3